MGARTTFTLKRGRLTECPLMSVRTISLESVFPFPPKGSAFRRSAPDLDYMSSWPYPSVVCCPSYQVSMPPCTILLPTLKRYLYQIRGSNILRPPKENLYLRCFVVCGIILHLNHLQKCAGRDSNSQTAYTAVPSKSTVYAIPPPAHYPIY